MTTSPPRLPSHPPRAILAAALLFPAALPLAAALLSVNAVQAQQLLPSAQGFSYGTSSGSSSYYRQESRSEAHVLLQQLTTNATPVSADGGSFSIDNPRAGFAVIQVRQSESASDGQTTVGGAAFFGSSYSVFSN
jgi:hypothetical protein